MTKGYSAFMGLFMFYLHTQKTKQHTVCKLCSGLYHTKGILDRGMERKGRGEGGGGRGGCSV